MLTERAQNNARGCVFRAEYEPKSVLVGDSRIMSKKRVTLLGGTGFVGTQLTCRLAQEFDEVILLTRHSQRSRALRILPNVHFVQTDVHDVEKLNHALSGSDVVINLVGILNSAGSNTDNSFNGAHTELTKKVVDACGKLGIARYLHMSSLNADAKNGSSEYLRSKGFAEDTVKASKSLNWTVFQPSVIFGEQDSFFNRFSALLTSLPIFPLACPDARMAPVYVGDVVESMMASLNRPAFVGQTIQLCGPQDYSLQELVEYTARTRGLSRKIIRLSDKMARIQARAMELVPGKPFSRDNYLSLQTDSVCEKNCERQKTSIDAIVPTYIGNAKGLTARHQSRREIARR